MERRLLGAPAPVERITYHAHSAPLHKIKTDNMLPSQLLTPFQVPFSALVALSPFQHFCMGRKEITCGVAGPWRCPCICSCRWRHIFQSFYRLPC